MFYYSAFILDFITLVLQIFLCWSIASNLQAKFLPTKSWPEQITYNYFLFFAYIILSLTVLGALGLLTLKYSIVLNLTAFALALKYCPKPPKLTFKADYKRLIFYLPLVLLLSILFVIASQQAVIEADSLTYHMPYIIKWLQEGSLWHPYYTAYVGVIGYYPGNYELLSLFTILPFNQDLFVNLINFSLYLPLGLCLYIIFRQLKVPEKTAQVLPALLLYTPLLVRQGPIPQNDLFYLLVLAFAFLFFIKKHWLAFAIALGLFLGTKANAIVYSALVFLPACYYIKDYKKILKVSALIILFGGFWYIRNWILTGNPLFPMHLETGGLTIFQGYQSAQESLKASAVFPQHITDLNLYKSLAINFFHSTGLIILSTVTAIIFTFFKHRRLLIMIVALFFVYLISPFSAVNLYPNIRYLIPLILFTTIVFSLISKPEHRVTSLLVLAQIVCLSLLMASQLDRIQFVNDFVFITIPSLLGTCFFLAVIISIALHFKHHNKLLTSLLSLFTLFLFFNYSFGERNINPYWDPFIRKQTIKPQGYIYVIHPHLLDGFNYVNNHFSDTAKIAYSGFGPHSPLYGPMLSREVDYINVNNCPDCIYHDYKTEPESILVNANFEDWWSNLNYHQKEFLFVGEMFDWSPNYEKIWAESNPDKFEKIYDKGRVQIYNITLE